MADMIKTLEAIIEDRAKNPSPGSYTRELLDSGRAKLAQKMGEEAVEVVVAALAQDKHRQIEEISDLLFHLLVLMSDMDITLAEVEAELSKRHQKRSGGQ